MNSFDCNVCVEETFTMMVVYLSDCCGVPSDEGIEICSRCGEHCEIVTEEYPA